MAGYHHGSARIERHLNTRYRRANASVFCDRAMVVLRNVQVSADKHTFATHLVTGTKI